MFFILIYVPFPFPYGACAYHAATPNTIRKREVTIRFYIYIYIYTRDHQMLLLKKTYSSQDPPRRLLMISASGLLTSMVTMRTESRSLRSSISRCRLLIYLHVPLQHLGRGHLRTKCTSSSTRVPATAVAAGLGREQRLELGDELIVGDPPASARHDLSAYNNLSFFSRLLLSDFGESALKRNGMASCVCYDGGRVTISLGTQNTPLLLLSALEISA